MITTFIGLIVMFALVFVDQITKAIAEAANVHSTFIPGLIDFDFVKHDGIALDIQAWIENLLKCEHETFMVIITVFTTVMVVVIAALYFTIFRKNRPAQIALAVIEAGAIGNLIDRFALGYVRDFVDVSSIGFGVCNIADFCITFGAVALVFIILFIGKHALFPLRKKWREEAKADLKAEEEKELRQKQEKQAKKDAKAQAAGVQTTDFAQAQASADAEERESDGGKA